MNYLLVCIVATSIGSDLMLKYFASCCVPFFNWYIHFVYRDCMGIYSSLFSKNQWYITFISEKKEAKRVREIAGSTPLPLFSVLLKIIKQVSRNIRPLSGKWCQWRRSLYRPKTRQTSWGKEWDWTVDNKAPRAFSYRSFYPQYRRYKCLPRAH